MTDFSVITACGESCTACPKKLDGRCPGCIEADGRVPEWAGSGRCRIHACARDHHVQFCGLCAEFPCEKLPEMIFWDPCVIGKMMSLRDEYLSRGEGADPGSGGQDNTLGKEWTFDTAADAYEKIRPGYPEELYRALFAYCPVGNGSRAVEVGIGGGQAALPVIQSIVTENGWLSLEEFADIITIAESTPGPIAINAATFTGVKIAGLPGAAVATLGFVLPTVLIVIIVSLIYDRFKKSKYVAAAMGGIRPAVVGMIAAAAVTIAALAFLGEGGPNISAILIFAVSFIYLRTAKPSPILVILAAGVVGGLIYSL